MMAGSNGASQSIDLAALMPKVAHRLLGEPNGRLSRGSRLRFGSKGSMEIDIEGGWFADHEADVRGGVGAQGGTVIPLGQAVASRPAAATVVHQHFSLDARGALTTPQFIAGIKG